MKVKVKELRLESGAINTLIHPLLAKALDVHSQERILLKFRDKKVASSIDISGDIVSKREIALSSGALTILGAKNGDTITILPLSHPKSISAILKKLNGKTLTKGEILLIVQDIVNNTLAEAEIAYFVSGVYEHGMTLQETKHLTEAIYITGKVLQWHNGQIADKHSIGGIPGNRTTPIVVAICAAGGVVIPKTSSRAITCAAGTADVMETITRVDFSAEELQAIVKKVGACLAWGGALGLAPADDKLIRVERLLNIDPDAQLIASILAKKLAVGSKYVLIDIPYGHHAKVTRARALNLKKKFLIVGKQFGLSMKVILSDGSQPIGNGIGPVLEMINVLRVLQRDNPPKDLETKAVMLAGIILEMVGKAKKGSGKKLAQELLNSKKALLKFNEIIEAQGKKHNPLEPSPHQRAMLAEKSGKLTLINNKAINILGRLLGAPADAAAGIHLHKHLGDFIKKGEPLLTFYSESQNKLTEACEYYTSTKPLLITA